MSQTIAPTGVSPPPSITLARSLATGVDELSGMGPFDLYKEQMDNGNTEAKVDAMKRLPVVAFALGSAKMQSELLPYLKTIALAQPPIEDELLLLMAKQMETFVPALLSDAKEILELVPIVERLGSIEETVVRNQAIALMNHLCESLEKVLPLDPSIVSSLVSMSKRLVGADWFTAKVSAAGMLPALYTVSDHADLPYLYKELCVDETPMVRRAAAEHLGKMLKALGNKDKANELIPVMQQLARDEQDSVRMLALASMSDVGDVYCDVPEWTKEFILPLLKDASTDLSWRVRHHLSKVFGKVAQSLGFQGKPKFINDQSLVMACFVSLLADVEAEVRAAAVGHFATMVHWGGSDLFVNHLLPLLPALADDVVMEVRSKCALAIMESSEGGTLEDTLIVQSFGPLIEGFLQDEFQEVQLQVLGNLHKLSHLLHGMNGVVSSILNMSKATNWRVRRGVAKLLPHLAEARGLDFFANVLMEPAWLVLLLDPVACVRVACVEGMSVLVKVAGQEWMSQQIMPQHVRIYSNAETGSYLIRITILQAHAETAKAVQENPGSGGSLWMDCVTHILKGMEDKVANVRMVAAQGLAKVVTADDADQRAVIESQIIPALEKQLADETDMDCQAACAEALEAAQSK